MEPHNPELQLANDFVRHTGRHIFLTGKAGTGKTTFLHQLKRDAPKRMIVTAPTGVAAINAGGVTLHSFFQLPFGPFVPGSDSRRQAEEHRLSRQKRDIIRTLDLLVIDEISMVRCDLLDAVDFVLRRHRRADLPFGGVQLLMIGDLHQLPPVVNRDDWELLKGFYDTGYFFGSAALRDTQVVSIELKRIYRQSDADFIELLNQVRTNRLDSAHLELLNSRYLPDFAPGEADNHITLTTHNRSADRINETRLQRLASKPVAFRAKVEGDYPAHSFPTAEELTLKQGAQVMFVRNDRSADKRYFNGKIGTVTRLDRERVVVRCPDDEEAIEVEPVTWENIQYRIDKSTKEISEEVIGKFVQYPLRLAWAITIHKSQGLTFERAIIDAGAAFSHGQVYVALSRCKTLEGMVLSSPISRGVVRIDQTVAHFVDEATHNPPTRKQLDQARTAYQQRLLQECWDFQTLGTRLGRLSDLLRDNRQVLDLQGGEAIHEVQRQTLDEVVVIGAKFRRQLQSLFREERIPEHDDHLQDRVRKASAYFSEKLESGLARWLRTFSFETDNKALGQSIRQAVKDLRQTLAIKTACVASCQGGFSTSAYSKALADAGLDQRTRTALPEKKLDYRDSGVAHPELLDALRQWRAAKEEEEEAEGVTRYRILTRAVLRQVADSLPASQASLLAIRGIGKGTAARYGAQLLGIVSDYCERHPLDPATGPGLREHTETDGPGGDSRTTSFRLYREGLSIAEIASRRSLKTSTIEGHLVHFVGTGQLPVTDFVSAEKVERIAAAFTELGLESLNPVKERLGEACSYGELAMVRAHMARG